MLNAKFNEPTKNIWKKKHDVSKYFIKKKKIVVSEGLDGFTSLRSNRHRQQHCKRWNFMKSFLEKMHNCQLNKTKMKEGQSGCFKICSRWINNNYEAAVCHDFVHHIMQMMLTMYQIKVLVIFISHLWPKKEWNFFIFFFSTVSRKQNKRT